MIFSYNSLQIISHIFYSVGSESSQEEGVEALQHHKLQETSKSKVRINVMNVI